MLRRPPRSTLFPSRRSSDLRLPDGAATRAAVEAVRADLAQVRGQLSLGRYPAPTAVAPLVERARKLGYAPLVAEALYTLGSIELPAETFDAAIAALEEAARTAYAARDDELAARAWITLISVTGTPRADAKAGSAAAAMAEAALERMPRVDPRLRVQLLTYEGLLQQTQGDDRAALGKLRAALALVDTLPAGHEARSTV